MNHFRLITNYLQCYINVPCINWISQSGHVDKLLLPLLVHHSHCQQQSVRQQLIHLGGVAGSGRGGDAAAAWTMNPRLTTYTACNSCFICSLHSLLCELHARWKGCELLELARVKLSVAYTLTYLSTIDVATAN